jgi:hypothetical protein
LPDRIASAATPPGSTWTAATGVFESQTTTTFFSRPTGIEANGERAKEVETTHGEKKSSTRFRRQSKNLRMKLETLIIRQILSEEDGDNIQLREVIHGYGC